jgi:5-oxoprolinase (ATP-hydrolysing) subunit A
MGAPTIDLNADMGEGFGAWAPAADERLMPLVSSANIACGFHASDPRIMRQTVRLAREHGVAVGAHPSFPDLVGFGRRMIAATPAEILDDVVYQVGALLGFCRAEGVPLAHVKPHGALYNAAAKDPAIAGAIAEAVRAVDPSLWLMGLAGSALVEAGRAAGLRCVEEAFADRGYARDGTLLPRGRPGALVTDPAAVADRVARLAREGVIRAADGTELRVAAGTVCVHGDTPGAVEVARAIRERLARDGVAVRSFSAVSPTADGR